MMNTDLISAKLEQLEDKIKKQEDKIQTLERQVRRLRDIEEIARLQRAYGYYLEHWMTEEIIDCFSDSPEVALYWLEGTWLGKAGVRRYFEIGTNPDPRFMHQLMQVCGIIDVDPDGTRAKGRWYAFGGMSLPEGDDIQRSLASGIYENEYIKENGVWKILTYRWTMPFSVKISEGWVTPEERAERIPRDEIKFKPDIRLTSDLRWITGYIHPFHYKHPVTGKETSENKHNASLKKQLT